MSSWKNNHGNRLLGFASVIAVLASTIWYFDLLPNITLVPTNSSVGVGTTVQERPTVLIATIVPPANMPETMNGYINLYTPTGKLSPETSPLVSRKFTLSEGEEQSIWIQELRRGNFTAVVYLDENNNEKLDFDESENPREKFLISGSQQATNSTDLEAGGFVLRQGQLHVLLFRF